MAHNVEITEASIDDCYDIWNWRNDEQARAMSLTTSEVDWEEHCAWFRKSLLDEDRLLYVCSISNEKEKIGMCRFDISSTNRISKISINLNPKMRGKKLSVKLLQASINAFREKHSTELQATIKRSNIASIRCFEKCGFVLDKKDEKNRYYVLPST